MTFSPFLGTFYTELKNQDMAENPDTVEAYVPMGTNDMTYWDTDGTEYQWNIIEDVSTWDQSSGYYCYILSGTERILRQLLRTLPGGSL